MNTIDNLSVAVKMGIEAFRKDYDVPTEMSDNELLTKDLTQFKRRKE